MSWNSIDRLEQLDLSQLKGMDLHLQYCTGRSLVTGSGRNKAHSYRNGIQTPVGDIEISVWIKAAEHLVERDGLQEEFERLRPYAQHLGQSSPFIKQISHVRHLDMCLSAIYKDPAWGSFIPYNQQYHPELLLDVPMAQIITECCQTLCAVPKARLWLNEGYIFCPICGRWSPYQQH